MIIGLLITLFVFMCIFMVLLILIQQGKSSMGLGSLGGGGQMLFGGSGGQDIFQKMTWVLGAIFIFGSLELSILRTQEYRQSRYVGQSQPVHMPAAPPMPK